MIDAIKRTLMRSRKIKKIKLGICAMDKKAKSKPMTEILKRFPEELFEIVIFGDECILNRPIEDWPVVEVLIAFYSTRFPSEKALNYTKLRNPYLINDLEMDRLMKDRRFVYNVLKKEGIDLPFHVFCERDDPNVENVVEEYDEYIVINGVQVNKPLVEKPIDAEDHNIYIYYPMSTGGGSKRLFRKVNDRSSEFYPHENEVRREGSYIYEEFVVTQGTDVKVYTVGADYGHAEARKSPVVDGKVKRDTAGLEVRYPVILSPNEKDMARKIVNAFKQTVCGFDILRVQGRSFCCDVNGFSFVKNSKKYYDDASQVLIELMVNTCRSDYRSRRLSNVKSRNSAKEGSWSRRDKDLRDKDTDSVSNSSAHGGQTYEDGRISPSHQSVEETEELRCVIAVIRHGDRTPKQKMKIIVTEQKYLDYFHVYAKNPRSDLKVKSKAALVRFLEVTKEVIADVQASGSNRLLLRQLKQIRDVLTRWEISGINRKLQMKPTKWEEEGSEEGGCQAKAKEVLVILKWGGDLTPLGKEQAERLGQTFRENMYPDSNGGGMLRLHATYRHDLKIKSSDEGRVMKTAAAFAKGLLELEGQLTPILASLVSVEEKTTQMLDRVGNRDIKMEMDRCKEQLNLLQQHDDILTNEIVDSIAPDCPPRVRQAILSLQNPMKTLQEMHSKIGGLCDQLQVLCQAQEDRESTFSMNSHHPSMESTAGDNSMPSTPRLQMSGSNDGVERPGSQNAVAWSPPMPPPAARTSSNNVHVKALSQPPPPMEELLKPLSSTPLKSTFMSIADDCGGSADWKFTFESVNATPEDKGNTKHATAGTACAGSAGGGSISQGVTYTGSGSVAGTGSNASSMQQSPSHRLSLPSQGLYLGETLRLMHDRWEKLYNDFYSAKRGQYDLSKVPDVYDAIRYEVLHNAFLGLDGVKELFDLSMRFENSVVPQEYGCSCADKRRIGSMMCEFLLEKIIGDLTVSTSVDTTDMRYHLDYSHADELAINSLNRCVRTRLYFTSESHLHTLLNVLRYAGPTETCAFSSEGLARLQEVRELSYLTQVVFRVFESKEEPNKFRCEISFSPGAVCDPFATKSSNLAPYITLNSDISCKDLKVCLQNAMNVGLGLPLDAKESAKLVTSASMTASEENET